VELALMELPPGEELAEMMSEVAEAAKSAAALTRQLLAFSRKQLIEPEVLDFNDVIVKLHRMLARIIGEDVALKTAPGEGLGAVKVDPGQLEQILVNLAVNARDAMPGGGELTIETANVELDDEDCQRHQDMTPGQFVMLAVSDTGHGMSEGVKLHLFEPFFTTKPKGIGTGLGLATIYGAVKQAGGGIEVDSEPGEGTTFKIYLPRVEREVDRLEPVSKAADMPGGTETILLVEDEAAVRALALRILTRLGYKVLHAEDGGQACKLAQEYAERIDLLMTDVVMPGMNGRQLAERVVRIHPEAKVLYSSGYSGNVIAHHGVIDEGLSFIGKPYSPQALARKLREILST
jgi:CheY-like chemotaxis protein